jgi:hypothetical protein
MACDCLNVTPPVVLERLTRVLFVPLAVPHLFAIPVVSHPSAQQSSRVQLGSLRVVDPNVLPPLWYPA